MIGLWIQIALSVPAITLGIGAWLQHVPGEWSRGALLAWSVVVYAFVVGTLSVSALPIWAAMPALLAGFVALAIGGKIGLAVAAALLFILAILAFAAVPAVPLLLCLVTAVATSQAAFPARIGG